MRAIIITGGGPSFFSAGADVKIFAKAQLQEQQHFINMGCDVFGHIEAFPKPVIAAVNGFCLGGGNELAMACDIRIAAQKARFGQPEIKLGLIPGWGGIQLLTGLIGKTRAQELLLTGEMLEAKEALTLGLIGKVVADEELMANAWRLARNLADLAPLAIEQIKRRMNAGIDAPLAQSVREDAQEFVRLLQTKDTKEGIAAFLEKRRPHYTRE